MSSNAFNPASMFTQDSKSAMRTEDILAKISTNRKYKRDICKNWAERGFCTFGNNCQFAHGQVELAVVDELSEEQLKAHEIFKTQNCRAFYREKFCPYGKRCQFRHEHRNFIKVHRHYWMPQTATLEYAFNDILAESK